LRRGQVAGLQILSELLKLLLQFLWVVCCVFCVLEPNKLLLKTPAMDIMVSLDWACWPSLFIYRRKARKL
jgi:hypothetical protein